MKTETTQHPDGTTTVKKTRWNCGCWSVIVVIFAAGLMISAWQAANLVERILMVAMVIAVVLAASIWADNKGLLDKKEAK